MATGATRAKDDFDAAGRMTAAAFRAFRRTRPREERWDLIDGVAAMMNPPTLVHQRIAANLERVLNDALERSRPGLFAYREVGVVVPGFANFQAVPDVAVLDAEATFATFAKRFHLVAEITSPSNTRERIAAKLRHYTAHPDNACVMVLDQRRIVVDVHARADGWRGRRLTGRDAVLEIAEFGLSTPLAALYRGTPAATS